MTKYTGSTQDTEATITNFLYTLPCRWSPLPQILLLNFLTSLFRDLLEAGGGALATPHVGAAHLMMRMRQEKEKELAITCEHIQLRSVPGQPPASSSPPKMCAGPQSIPLPRRRRRRVKLGLCASLLAPSSNDNWVAAMRRCRSRPTTTKYIYVTQSSLPLYYHMNAFY